MIHAFAIAPEVVARWARSSEFRYFSDKFGIGTPRIFLEMPSFNKWRRRVVDAAAGMDLSDLERTYLEELLRTFSYNPRLRRLDGTTYDGHCEWLENAEREYNRRPFRGILATDNPRCHPSVFDPSALTAANELWMCATSASATRAPAEFAKVLSGMINNARCLHLVDPHFDPSRKTHTDVLRALLEERNVDTPRFEQIKIHSAAKLDLSFFDLKASQLSRFIREGTLVEFVRWRKKDGGDKLHNRYVLTDIGGVSFGVGLDAGEEGETDDLFLLSKAQYNLRWSQYAEEKGFLCVDRPRPILGTA